MSVYVDNPRVPFGRMKMCHMMADTTNELLAMAKALGLEAHWIQNAGTPREHFDVCLAKRRIAIERGAKAVSSRDLVDVIRAKREAIAA